MDRGDLYVREKAPTHFPASSRTAYGEMENNMETTIMQGLYWGYLGAIDGLYRDNGKENGSYHDGLVEVHWRGNSGISSLQYLKP